MLNENGIFYDLQLTTYYINTFLLLFFHANIDFARLDWAGLGLALWERATFINGLSRRAATDCETHYLRT